MPIEGRELGSCERYPLSHTLVKHPPIITYLAVLTATPSHSEIQASISHLLAQYPFLACSVPEPNTPHPRFSHNPSLHAEQIFRTTHSDVPHADVLKSELDAAREDFDVQTGPLWRVTLYTGATAPRLVLTLNHVLSDGVGGRNLFGQLLSSIRSPTEPVAPASVLPPTLESTVDVRQGYLYMLGAIFNEFVAPRLPSFLTLSKTPIWPNPTPIRPVEGQERVVTLSLPANWVPRLKVVGATHGVKTLHPMLHTCALVALSAAVGGREIRAIFNTPVSLRDPSVGHPYATGNYVGNHEAPYPRLSPGVVFWAEARKYAESLVDPGMRAAAKGAVGMLAYVPNPERMPHPEKSGWEVWMGERIDSKWPLGTSMELSNVGVLQEELEGVKEVVFAQTPGPAGAGLTMNLISSKGGPLSITTSFREGVIPTELVNEFHAKFTANVEALAKNAIAEDARFGDLV